MRVADDKRLDAADMIHKIQVMREGTRTQNATTGAWTDTAPVVLCELWAAANGLYGQEYWSARQMQQESTITFKVFYHPALANLTTKDYIAWNGENYDIQYPDNLNFENNIVKIRAVKRT